MFARFAGIGVGHLIPSTKSGHTTLSIEHDGEESEDEDVVMQGPDEGGADDPDGGSIKLLQTGNDEDDEPEDDEYTDEDGDDMDTWSEASDDLEQGNVGWHE